DKSTISRSRTVRSKSFISVPSVSVNIHKFVGAQQDQADVGERLLVRRGRRLDGLLVTRGLLLEEGHHRGLFLLRRRTVKGEAVRRRNQCCWLHSRSAAGNGGPA